MIIYICVQSKKVSVSEIKKFEASSAKKKGETKFELKKETLAIIIKWNNNCNKYFSIF